MDESQFQLRHRQLMPRRRKFTVSRVAGPGSASIRQQLLNSPTPSAAAS